MFARAHHNQPKTDAATERRRRAPDPADEAAHSAVWQTLALRTGTFLQPKLAVGPPSDPYEQEADRLADEVTRIEAPRLQRACACGGSCPKCAGEENEGARVQTKRVQATGGGEQAAAPPVVEEVLRAPGRQLDAGARAFMEERFGHDFGGVRVHTDARAAASARMLDAAAYTSGRDIVFAEGQYAPATSAGRRLLGHELTHVVQQAASGGHAAARGVVQRSMATYVKAMQQKPEPDFKTAAEHLNGESVRDIKIVLKNLSAQHRVELHKAARDWPGVCSNIARLTEADYLKVEPTAKKAAESCKEKPPEAAPAKAPVKEAPPPPPLTAVPGKCEADSGDIVVKCLVKNTREEVRHMMEGDIYETKLKEAVKLLEKAGFGRAEGLPAVFGPTGVEGWKDEKFNQNYWKIEQHPKFYGKLVLKPGILPSIAIDDMFLNLRSWNVECAQFVQVANLYALRYALGTDGFNKLPRSTVSFELKKHGSTGMERVKFYERFSPGEQMLRYPEKEREPKSVDELLKEVPVGSRVMWRNLETTEDSPYYNENTVKLGEDQYAAHGFMKDEKKNIFTRKELELVLAKTTNPTPDEKYIKDFVFIAEIEHYRRPQNPKKP